MTGYKEWEEGEMVSVVVIDDIVSGRADVDRDSAWAEL